jgi:hypothetical protein
MARLTGYQSLARAWVKAELANGLMEISWLYEFNCAEGRYRTIESITRTGKDVTTQRHDENDPFVAIGAGSRFAPAYAIACKSTVGMFVPPSDEPSAVILPTPTSGDEGWRLFAMEDGFQHLIDLASMRISEHRVLAWTKAVHPLHQDLLVLFEYDCKAGQHRAHAVNSGRFPQPGGWSHPSSLILSAFRPICREMETQYNQLDKSAPAILRDQTDQKPPVRM